MSWNPDNYNQFKEIRFEPFYDLAELIVGDTILNAVDWVAVPANKQLF